MRYVITDTSVIRISETYGTIQNIGRDKIELSNSADFENVFLLYSLNQVSFNAPLYIRAYNNGAKKFNIPVNVVQFITGGTGTSNEETTANDVEEYLDEIFSGERTETIDDDDINAYLDNIFSGETSVILDDPDFNSYLDNIYG